VLNEVVDLAEEVNGPLDSSGLEMKRAKVEAQRGWETPLREEIDLFNNALRDEGVTPGQLFYRDLHSPEFNSDYPNMFRVKRNIRADGGPTCTLRKIAGLVGRDSRNQ
jgi:hypothetical protein